VRVAPDSRRRGGAVAVLILLLALMLNCPTDATECL
jgi:hypothetical protein